ncbi:MAG TPA: heat-inducible transcriptional repressor HrcA [Blastocatellia bacterium]|nr:heat-inducible transcriptional repressor HrcA [Blastocatellia bacterium]
MQHQKDTNLGERDKEVLASVIKLHIQTGEPIGSVTLAQRSRENLSSATIRNILSDLEAAGYLTHPHTSAGRMPTDKGYRFYVDHMLESRTRPSKSDEAVIRRYLNGEEPLTTQELMERTSHLLSEVSENVGFVLTPFVTHDPLKHLKFVKLADHRILVIIVLNSGLVQDRVIRVTEDFTQDELDRAARYVVENYSGKNLIEIRNDLIQLMKEEKALYDRMLQNVILLCNKGLDAGVEAEVYVDGASNMLNRPDFLDTDKMQALFRMFEEKSKLVRILNECINVTSGVSVKIGSENALATMQNCAIIASPYTFTNNIVGGIGIVGPTRMEYARVISIVEYVAKLFERALNADT